MPVPVPVPASGGWLKCRKVETGVGGALGPILDLILPEQVYSNTWFSEQPMGTFGFDAERASSLGAGFRFANPQFPIGIYLVKKFQWDINGNINWNPEPDLAEFKNWGMDLVIAFNMDIY